jgi:hypothetical protein
MGTWKKFVDIIIYTRMGIEKKLLTVIISASYIPSHPSIELIKETIESLKFINKKNIDVLITHDYSNDKDYQMYLNKLRQYIKTLEYENIKLLVSDKHVHLTGTIRNAIKEVNTKYILIVQHDLPFIKHVNMDKIISDMEENPKIKHVRFNKRKNIKLIFDSINDLFGHEVDCKNYTYTRTPAWSDQNHICLTTYYTDLILHECKDGNFMEEQIHGKSIDEESHSKWGTYLLGENGGEPYIKHLDGKKFSGIKKKLPFMTSEEIVDLTTYIGRDSIMLEIGGGDSTVFLSRLVKKIVTLEHNLEWAEKIRENTKGFMSTVFVVEPNWPQSHPFQPAEDGQFENYLNFLKSLDDDQFDVVLVDGRDRVKCVSASIPKLKRDGILLIHDFWNRPKYHSVLDFPEFDLILDSNSYGKNPNNTLVAFRKK